VKDRGALRLRRASLEERPDGLEVKKVRGSRVLGSASPPAANVQSNRERNLGLVQS